MGLLHIKHDDRSDKAYKMDNMMHISNEQIR